MWWRPHNGPTTSWRGLRARPVNPKPAARPPDGRLAALSSSPIAPLWAPPPPCDPSRRRPLATAKIYGTRPSYVMAGVAILTGLAVAGCGSGPPSPVGTAGASSPSATPGGRSSSDNVSSGRPRAPLTGLPVPSSVAARPAVALDVSGDEPHGLTAADVVLEEF